MRFAPRVSQLARQRRQSRRLRLIVRDAAQGAVLHIAEGAHHPGDIAQRRMFGAPLLQAVARLALEIDDDEVIAGHQHLAQVIVAVNADFLARAASLPRRPRCAFMICSRCASTALARSRSAAGTRIQVGRQQVQRAARLVERALPVGVDVGRG